MRTPLTAAFAVFARAAFARAICTCSCVCTSALLLASAGCAGPAGPGDTALTASRLAALLPADVLLIGEQHDAPAHQRIEREAVQALAQRGQLAALAIEMAEQGKDTSALQQGASEAAVRAALAWSEKNWPWATYGPVVMAAVRSGVPVFGANLPRANMKEAMRDASLDTRLPAPALAAQQAAVREGHCHLLPETQIGPMTRVQIARDQAMAQTVRKLQAPDKTVLLISGAGHSTKALGVPQMLPDDVRVRSVRLLADGNAKPQTGAAGIARAASMENMSFDVTWHTPALPPRDYCAEFKRTRG